MNLPTEDEGLKRSIGVRALALNAVNLTVGAGIFALPAVVAFHLGASAFWAYLMCGLLLSLVLLCFVELGTKITTSGGAYAYVETAFGPLAGFLTNTVFWLGFSVLADAAVAIVMVDNLAVFVPALTQPLYRVFFLFIVFGGLASINIMGVKEGAGFVVVVTLVKLLPLLLLIALGWTFVKAENFSIVEQPSLQNLGEGALVLFFAFGGGVEATLSASGEIKDPKRTIPRGLLLGVLMVFFIYISIQLVSQGVLGNELALQGETPLVAVAEKIFGNYGGALMVAAAAFSCFALISGDILVSSRIPYAAARDGLLPHFLAKIHPKFATPYRAIILYASIGFLLSVSGGFRQLAVLSSSSILLVYVAVIAATIRLRKMKSENAYTNPGGLLVPVLALLATSWFLSNLSLNEIIALIIFLGVFIVFYFLMRLRRS